MELNPFLAPTTFPHPFPQYYLFTSQRFTFLRFASQRCPVATSTQFYTMTSYYFFLFVHYLLDFEKWNPDQFSYCDLLNTCIMCMEMNALEERTQVCGAVLICSGANFGFKQFRNVGFQDLKNSALMLQVCSGHTSTRFLLRMSGCHRWLIGSW